MATYAQLPLNKGYDSFYGYLSKSISYFEKLADNECDGSPFIDLWSDDAPAYDSMDKIDNSSYVEFEFRDKVKELITSYEDSDDPFFIMYSMHLPHYPTEIPAEYLEIFGDDENYCADNNDYIYPGYTNGTSFHCRSALQSQVKLMDVVVGDVVETLKQANLWDNTLIVFTSDNGGSLELSDTAGNNYPLRGGKGNDLEGGVRATSFVSGGFLPVERAGDVEMGLMHLADWYATFCAMAGVEATDEDATSAGLPDVDGINMWPLISGRVQQSPRSELAISHDAYIWNNYKFMTGEHKYAVWQSAVFPNSSSANQTVLEEVTLSCKIDGCLFDVVNDPSEHEDLAHLIEYSAILNVMKEKLKEINEDDIWANEEQGVDSCPSNAKLNSLSCGCWMAYNNFNGFVGPYQDLTEDQMLFLDRDNSAVLGKETVIGFHGKTRGNDFIYFVLSMIGFVAMIVIVRCVKGMNFLKKEQGLMMNGEDISYGTNL